jgi:hypothetical protein
MQGRQGPYTQIHQNDRTMSSCCLTCAWRFFEECFNKAGHKQNVAMSLTMHSCQAKMPGRHLRQQQRRPTFENCVPSGWSSSFGGGLCTVSMSTRIGCMRASGGRPCASSCSKRQKDTEADSHTGLRHICTCRITTGCMCNQWKDCMSASQAPYCMIVSITDAS